MFNLPQSLECISRLMFRSIQWSSSISVSAKVIDLSSDIGSVSFIHLSNFEKKLCSMSTLYQVLHIKQWSKLTWFLPSWASSLVNRAKWGQALIKEWHEMNILLKADLYYEINYWGLWIILQGYLSKSWIMFESWRINEH